MPVGLMLPLDELPQHSSSGGVPKCASHLAQTTECARCGVKITRKQSYFKSRNSTSHGNRLQFSNTIHTSKTFLNSTKWTCNSQYRIAGSTGRTERNHICVCCSTRNVHGRFERKHPATYLLWVNSSAERYPHAPPTACLSSGSDRRRYVRHIRPEANRMAITDQYSHRTQALRYSIISCIPSVDHVQTTREVVNRTPSSRGRRGYAYSRLRTQAPEHGKGVPMGGAETEWGAETEVGA